MAIRFTLNDLPVEVDDFDPNTTLLAFLRARGMTGTKEGCAEGECGACAVAWVHRDALGNTRYQPVNACLLLLGSCAGREIVSIEGIARGGELHPVQQAMVDRAGSQCGYCTPGFVVSLFAEYYRPGRTELDPEAIAGNLCRCTGYRPIREVAERMGQPDESDPFRRRLALAPPPLEPVRHGSEAGRFLRPSTLSEALALLAEEPGAVIVAGGTDVMVEVNQRHRRHLGLLSLENVAELTRFEYGAACIRIGAALSLTEVEQHLAGRVPLLEQLFPLFSSRLIRNRATLGGNLMTASPIGDGAPALLALDAEVELVSLGGTRTVPLSELFTGYRQTARKPDEILSAITIPLPLPDVQRFYKVSKRVLDDISTVAAAFSLRLEPSGKVHAARLAYGGVAATPARARDAEAFMVGQIWSRELALRTQPLLARAFSPIGDHRGSADYRSTMIVRLLEKLWVDSSGGAA